MRRVIQGSRMVITGASSGIGRALATAAVKEGARVILAARSVDRLDALARELSAVSAADVLAVPTDITVEADRRRLLQAAVDHFGGLDVLVNNAGVASFGHFAASNEEILRQIMDVNFFGPAELTREAVPLLKEGRQPAVVNVSSMTGRRGTPAWPEYSASKFALCGLTEALRAEFARFDIDVLLIVPGLTNTELRQHMLLNTGRMKIAFDDGMAPEYVAATILNSLRTNRTETVVGSEAKWILRVNRWLPRLVDRLMARRVRQLYAAERPVAPPAAGTPTK
ncbi:MAG: SDR family oxidoreductase [Gemmataceae bacterium]